MNYTKNSLKQEYLKQSVMTATPGELIVMLYNACIKNLKLAELCLQEEKRNLEGANEHFLKAQKIILELINCLDTNYEISGQLLPIYRFLLQAIREMNAKKDVSELPGVLEILGSLRDTWQSIVRPQMASSEVG